MTVHLIGPTLTKPEQNSNIVICKFSPHPDRSATPEIPFVTALFMGLVLWKDVCLFQNPFKLIRMQLSYGGMKMFAQVRCACCPKNNLPFSARRLWLGCLHRTLNAWSEYSGHGSSMLRTTTQWRMITSLKTTSLERSLSWTQRATMRTQASDAGGLLH